MKRLLLLALLCLISLLLPQNVRGQTQLINSSLVVVGHENMCTTGPTSTPVGPPTAYACTFDRAISTYVTKACYQFLADVANTGAATLNLHGLGAKAITKVQGGIGTPLVANDIRAGAIVRVCYDGTQLQMTSQLGNAPTGAGTPSGSGGQAQYNSAGALGGTSGLTVNATDVLSRKDNVTALSANTTLGTHNVLAMTVGSGGVTLTLPAASTTTTGTYKAVIVDTGTGTLTLTPNGSDTLNSVNAPLTVKGQNNGFDIRRVSSTGWSVETIDRTIGRRYVTIECVPDSTALTTGDGACYWPVHADFAGWTVVDAKARVGAAVSSAGAVNVDIDICGAVATGIRCSGTNRDLLSTNITIDANEDRSETAATPRVINPANDDLAAGEWVRWNIDAAGTGTQGLYVTITIQQ
jgi:hypothetical protein